MRTSRLLPWSHCALPTICSLESHQKLKFKDLMAPLCEVLNDESQKSGIKHEHLLPRILVSKKRE